MNRVRGWFATRESTGEVIAILVAEVVLIGLLAGLGFATDITGGGGIQQPPSARVYQTTPLAITTPGAYATLTYAVTSNGTDAYLKGGITYSAGKFTVPKSGVYIWGCSTFITTSGTPTLGVLQPRRNSTVGLLPRSWSVLTSSVTTLGTIATGSAYFAVGDTLDCQQYQDGSNPTGAGQANLEEPSMWMEYLHP